MKIMKIIIIIIIIMKIMCNMYVCNNINNNM